MVKYYEKRTKNNEKKNFYNNTLSYIYICTNVQVSGFNDFILNLYSSKISFSLIEFIRFPKF